MDTKRTQQARAAAAADAADASRRRMLVWGAAALLGAAATLAAGRRAASAMRTVEADAATASAYHDACGAVDAHRQLFERAREQLLRMGLDPDTLAAAPPLDCPVCGCRVSMRGSAPGDLSPPRN